MHATDLLLWGIVAHLIADWLLQNEWMANNKSSLRHPAGWVHGAIHGLALLFVFSPLVALVLALAHVLVDTRQPLDWWRRFFRQTTSGTIFPPFAMWEDQTVHIGCLALAALLVGRP
ncbi:MAG TPA: DUF3307 domain-containing protein [Chloroflexia bacterium]|nr:DUF3307 domain-containing protein [Chloroflexia bacterium]